MADSTEDNQPQSPAKTAGSAFTGLSDRKVILTTHSHQVGIDPIPLVWGEADPQKRGPIVVSRHDETIKRRNAIGAHGGPYSIYQALAVASGGLTNDYIPDFTDADPMFDFKQQPQWGDPKKIVSMDPFGHISPWEFKQYRDQGIDIRPTIAVTKARMSLPDFTESVRAGRMKVDGNICVNDKGDLSVTKVAVDPVWHLPGVSERFGISETELRHLLFDLSGGSFPELISRPDVKVFLPPIGGFTAYIFGDPRKLSDPNARLALRVHDECNGSDVFGSDICTCRPYLIFGIEEAVRMAQEKDGVGLIVYFRKEGRALGEVTKYLVYNARKRSADLARDYFVRTEKIAGIKDMRFQTLMPDILHWFGITKIDKMLSMSNMKHDAIVSQGIEIKERIPIPDELIPEDGKVEIEAKIRDGYFADGKVVTEDDLEKVRGRTWDDVYH